MPNETPAALDRKIAQTAVGPIEYAVLGTGRPVLVIHGSPGGIDAAELMSRFLPRDEIAAIVVSRPGYLGTEIGERRTIDDQADLLAALVEQLGFDHVGILAWSGGGPAAYRLAVRRPDLVASLVVFAGVSQAYRVPKTNLATRLMFTTGAGQWLMRLLAAHQPKEYIAGTLSSEGDLTKEQLKERVAEVFADDNKREFVLALGPTASQGKDRRAGYVNDLAQFDAIDSLQLPSISAPTLIIQGSADSDLPPEHSHYAVENIPGAELINMETGTHLALYTHPDAVAVQARVIDFLLRS